MHARSSAQKQFPYTYTLHGWKERINGGEVQPVGTFATDALDGFEEYAREESLAVSSKAYRQAVNDVPDRICKRYKFSKLSRKEKQGLRDILGSLYAMFIKDFPPPFVRPEIVLVDVSRGNEIEFLAQTPAALALLSAHFGIQRDRLRLCVCCDRAFVISRWDKHRRVMCDRCLERRPADVRAWNLPPHADGLWKKSLSQMRMRFERNVSAGRKSVQAAETFRQWRWQALADLVYRLRDDPKCNLDEWRKCWIPTVKRGRPRKSSGRVTSKQISQGMVQLRALQGTGKEAVSEKP